MDPYAFTGADGSVYGTYADPSAEFGAPGWSYGNFATYADPSQELGWGTPIPAWASYNAPGSYMYGMFDAGFWTLPKIGLAAAAVYFLLPKGTVGRVLQNPFGKKRRRKNRKGKRRSRRSRR